MDYKCVASRLQNALAGDNTDHLSPVHADKYCELKGPRKSESMPNCYTKLSQEPMRLCATLSSDEAQHPINVQSYDNRNESVITMNSCENVPQNDKTEMKKDDLRKYVKMVSLRDWDFIKCHCKKNF